MVLEIVDRCDPATIVVCAATCRLLRRHILDPAFTVKLRRRAAASRRSAASSLLGLFYRHYKEEAAPRPPPFTPTTSTPGVVRSPFEPHVFNGYTPVESRGGLLVLRDSSMLTERPRLCVYDPITRRRAFLPPPEVHQQSYALFTRGVEAGVAAAMFVRLVVLDLSLLRLHHTVRAQSFSPDNGGAWGTVIEAPTPVDHLRDPCSVAQPSPVIIGGVLHWLCTDLCTILTFNPDTLEVGTVQFPYHHRMCWGVLWEEPQLLASSAHGELSMLVVERLVISVWVRQTTGRWEWTRRAVVDLERILSVPAEAVLPYQPYTLVRLEWAGEMSGTVVAQVAGVGLMVLNLDAEELVCEVRKSRNSNDVGGLFRYCPYELDLVSRLAAMARL